MGWGEGLEPKLIKGPDVLLSVAERLRDLVPELCFLLTGPSRGFVRAGLERLGIPYRHALLDDVDAVVTAYEAIDVCVVASRDEGGPRAVLESMATGVPLVTTRVGQAADLVQHGVNGWMVDVDDVEALAGLCRARRRSVGGRAGAHARGGPRDCGRELVPGASSSVAGSPRGLRRHGRGRMSAWT